MKDYLDAQVKQALLEARSIPGGSYRDGAQYDPHWDQLAAEAKAAEAVYPAGATSKALVDWLATGAESKAIVEDSTGAILLPPDLEVDIAALARERGRIRDLASVRPTTRNKHQARMLQAASVGWGRLETGATATDAAVAVESPGQEIEVHDLLAFAKIGFDELDDSPEAARAAVVEAIGSAIADAEDLAFAAGTGSSQPKGLSLAANITRVPAGQKTTAVSPPTAANMRALPWLLPARYRAGAAWLLSTDAASAVAVLTGTGGDLIWPEPGPNGRGIMGWPAYEVPGLPVMTGTNSPSILFANLQAAYRIADRQQITVQRLGERYADQGLIGLIVKRRVGGDLIRPDAVSAYLL